ncbi:hypothetical protein MHYP_G00222690 [Metynnis hypsauchen]
MQLQSCMRLFNCPVAAPQQCTILLFFNLPVGRQVGDVWGLTAHQGLGRPSQLQSSRGVQIKQHQ